jgi:uncharacterized SAM-binding protein YcdF (DUF218 family)
MANDMVMIERSVELVFSPLGIVTLVMAAGLVLSAGKRHRRAGSRLLVCGSLLFLIFLFSPLAEYLVLDLERPYPPMITPPESPKVTRIVVLAGYAEEHPGFPVTSNVSGHTTCSIAEGLRLYRLVPEGKLVLSGGVVRRGERPVAAMMAEFLRQVGVPDKDLIVEGKSQNTYENLVEVRKLLGPDPFILVAAGCDLRRAVAVARKLHMTPLPAPSCIWASQHHPEHARAGERIAVFFKSFHPSLDNFHRLQWAYHEFLGYLWYQLQGRI